MFTKRFKRWVGSAPAGRKYYSVLLLGQPGGASAVSLGNPLLLDTDWETFSVVKTASRLNSPGTNNPVYSPVVLYPSSDQPDAAAGTEATFTDLVQRLVLLRGWTPVWSSHASGTTSVNITIASDRVYFSPLGGSEVD
jgi:hypothetical protein